MEKNQQQPEIEKLLSRRESFYRGIGRSASTGERTPTGVPITKREQEIKRLANWNNAVNTVMKFNDAVGRVRSDSPEFEAVSSAMETALAELLPDERSLAIETARAKQEEEAA